MKRKPKVEAPKNYGAWCCECGPLLTVDEDGCCPMCGNGAMGPGAAKALRLLKRADPRRDAVVKAAVKWATYEPNSGRLWTDVEDELKAAVEKMQRGGKR